MRSLETEQTQTLSVDPTQGFSATSYTSQALASFPKGYAFVTMFVNGTPSTSQIVRSGLNDQTIAFPKIKNHYTTDASFTPPATASSGLPVTLSYVSGPATVSNNVVTLTGSTGIVVIQADQAGNGTTYAAAPPVQQSFGVYSTQTITFPTIPAQTYANPNPTATLSATSSSGLPITYQVTSGPGSISGTTLTFTGAGNVRVKASQPGTAFTAPATSVVQTINVAKAAQTITYHPQVQTAVYPSSPIQLQVTATSGLPVTVTLRSDRPRFPRTR